MPEIIRLNLPEFEYDTARVALLQSLRRRTLYNPDSIYRGFGVHMINRVLKYGSEARNELYIYGNDEAALSIAPDPLWENPLSYAFAGGALAIYEEKYLFQTTTQLTCSKI